MIEIFAVMLIGLILLNSKRKLDRCNTEVQVANNKIKLLEYMKGTKMDKEKELPLAKDKCACGNCGCGKDA